MSDSGEFVFILGFSGEVFRLVDVFLEPVVGGSIFIFSWFLIELGEVLFGSDFGVEGVEVLVVILSELRKDFVFGFKVHVGHSVIPFL